MKPRSYGRRAAAALGWLALALGAHAAGIDGRWKLVEQRYESGISNLAAPDLPVHLEFSRSGGVLSARIWGGDDPDRAVSWPAFATDAGPIAVDVVERQEDAATGSVTARYRVRPSPDDDLILDITESYALADGGAALEGTMQVRFTGGRTNRGGFTLYRRYAREP